MSAPVEMDAMYSWCGASILTCLSFNFLLDKVESNILSHGVIVLIKWNYLYKSSLSDI